MKSEIEFEGESAPESEPEFTEKSAMEPGARISTVPGSGFELKNRKISCCAECGIPVSHDEEAITRKLINRGTHTFYCKKCLSKFFEISIANLDRIIEHYKKQGCTLFVDADQ